jgi:hypothetical protein
MMIFKSSILTSTCLLTCFLVVSTSCAAEKIESYRLDSLAGLKMNEVVATSVTYKGRAAAQAKYPKLGPGGYAGPDRPTFAFLPVVDFRNGTIEVDVAGSVAPNAPKDAPLTPRGFVGIVFRLAPDLSKFEGIYLRPANARAEDQVRRNHATQYFSYPGYTFVRLRKESPEKYESYVDLVPGEWTTMRIEVNGEKVLLYVNGSAQPVLVVNDLKLGSEAHGSIGMWVDIGTEAYFSNLRITARGKK